jgi:hypothetical protein
MNAVSWSSGSAGGNAGDGATELVLEASWFATVTVAPVLAPVDSNGREATAVVMQHGCRRGVNLRRV